MSILDKLANGVVNTDRFNAPKNTFELGIENNHSGYYVSAFLTKAEVLQLAEELKEIGESLED